MNKSVFAPAVAILLFASAILSAHGWNPSDAAKANFTAGDGLSWRVAFDKGAAVLSRPRRHLPLETYKGTTDTILTIAFSQSAEAGPAIRKSAWDYLQAEYPLSRGSAVLTVNRLCPAVLLQSPAKSAAFNCPAGPAFIAFVRGGKPAVYETTRLAGLSPGDFSMSEPWIVAWFAAAAPAKAHIRPHDVENELGVSKGPTGYNRPPDAVDVPILFRLEHKAVSIRRAGQNGLVLTFAETPGRPKRAGSDLCRKRRKDRRYAARRRQALRRRRNRKVERRPACGYSRTMPAMVRQTARLSPQRRRGFQNRSFRRRNNHRK